jgi:hypothetical protein
VDKTIAALILIAITVAAGFIVYGNFNQLATTVSTTSSTLIDAQASMAQDSEQTLLIINVQNTGGKPITDVTAQFRDSSGRTYTWKVFNGTLQPGQSAANKLAVTRINFIKGGQLPLDVYPLDFGVDSRVYAKYYWPKNPSQVLAFTIPDIQLSASYNVPLPSGVYTRSGVVEADGKTYVITFDYMQGGSYVNIWNLEAQSLFASIPSSSTVVDAAYGSGAIFMVEQSGRLIRVGLDGSVSTASLGETLQRIVYDNGKLLICGSSHIFVVDPSTLSILNEYIYNGLLQPIKQAYYVEDVAALNLNLWPSAPNGDPWSILAAGWLQGDMDAWLPCYTVNGKAAQRWAIRQISTNDVKGVIWPWIPSNYHGVVFYDPSQTPWLDYSDFIWFYKARVGVLDARFYVDVPSTWWSISFTPTGFYKGNSYTITVTATATDGSQCTRTVTATVQ